MPRSLMLERADTAAAPPWRGVVRRLRPEGIRFRALAPRARWDVLAVSLYALAALVFQRHAVAHLGSACACTGDDSTQFMWSMTWWPHAIFHGLNPFVTHLIWAPHAINVAAQRTTPGPALIAAPLTAVAGPLVSYNVLNLLAPVIDGWFAYRLCLYLTGGRAASVVGGYLFGLSSFGIGQLQGHLMLVFTFGLPVAVLLTLKRLDGAISARRYVLLMAVTLILQLSCGTEITFTLACMGIVALVAGWIFASGEMRSRIVALIPNLIAALAVLAVVCAPYLYYALTGPETAAGRGKLFPADALSFVIPSLIERIGGHRFLPVTNPFVGDLGEIPGTYVGLPVVLMVGAYLIERWQTRAAKVIASVIAVAVIWSLGETLYIDGHPTIALPWKLLAGLPLFDEVLPVRIGLYLSLACAVAVALWLAATSAPRVLRWALAFLAIACLVPDPDIKYPHTTVALYSESFRGPAFFSTNLYRRYLHRNEVVLPLPYGPDGPSLLWQARTGMYFRLASGDFYVPPDYWYDPAVQQMMQAPPVPLRVVPELRSLIARYRVSAIVVQPGQPGRAGQWLPILARLGLRGDRVGGVVFYRVRDTSAPSA